MTIDCKPLALAAALVAAAMLGPAAIAQESAAPPRPVTWVCQGCHGIDGNSNWPIVPNLGAQNATYLEQQLNAFRAGPIASSIEIPAFVKAWFVKPEPLPKNARSGLVAQTFMTGPAHHLQRDEIKAVSEWYSKQPPPPGRPGNPELVDKGRALFDKGDPAAGVPPCHVCHGKDGRGIGPFPRVGGQNAAYVLNQLRGFLNGDRPAGSPMHGIAKDLTDAEREAVAAFVQSL
jgi:cytochrome c553